MAKKRTKKITPRPAKSPLSNALASMLFGLVLVLLCYLASDANCFFCSSNKDLLVQLKHDFGRLAGAATGVALFGYGLYSLIFTKKIKKKE
jgi:hypothetical protein